MFLVLMTQVAYSGAFNNEVMTGVALPAVFANSKLYSILSIVDYSLLAHKQLQSSACAMLLWLRCVCVIHSKMNCTLPGL